ncbi:hypothetical protein AUC70_06045 [Methyloceanibacter stevinii]|uniref:Corrinoid adenosyltransferase n=1 Tax=Methyloceanibacter stevinii TaxID=1774970 RepID=A0A1E3VPK9_9HYPH|nr:ATP:cob(I)alamin adenosyltransferase [Methyloceanibacter stevinii]ODR95251.1 hypothetical protein AUC70_06045 [Methyloceanibacter stevinii]
MEQLRRQATAHPGDCGQTKLDSGVIVDKDSVPVEAIGAIVELRAWIAVLISLSSSPLLKSLRAVRADLAAIIRRIKATGTPRLSQESLERIDAAVEGLEAELTAQTPNMRVSELPTSAFAEVAYAVCLRAERRLAELNQLNNIADAMLSTEGGKEAAGAIALAYLNRLSDLLRLLEASCGSLSVPSTAIATIGENG